MNPTIEVNGLARALAILSTADPAQLQSFLGVQGIQESEKARRKGYTFVTAKERKWYGKKLTGLAESVCPLWSRDDFKPSRWMDACMETVRKYREATPESALAFLLRKGIQTLANDWYIVVPREYQDYALMASSNAVAEWYGPLYASTVAGRVPRGDRFPEGRIIGEDSVLVNQKFGIIEAFDRELFDDDMTGQIRQRAQRLGQSMAVTENAYAALRFIGSAAQYSNLLVPASNYSTTDSSGNLVSSPWSSTLHGTYGNRPATYVALALNPLKNAWSDLLNTLDPQQNKIIVNPNTLLHSSMDALHAPLLVAPPAGVPYYPAVIGASGSTASNAASGFPGGVFGANPFMGLGIKPVLARFLPAWAWAIGERAKGFIFQERDPLEVMQENPATGAAFEVDAYRFRSRRRFEADWIGGGSRVWWLGNPGVDQRTNVPVVAGGSSGVAGTF
jgi:hypothetical protein